MRRALLLAAVVLALLSLPRRGRADECPPNEPCDLGDGGTGRCSANGSCEAFGEGC